MIAKRIILFAGLCGMCLTIAACRTKPARVSINRSGDASSQSSLRDEAIVLLRRAAVSDTPLYRANALEGLEQSPGDASDLVLDAMSDSNLGVRFTAALLAGRLELYEAVLSLNMLLEDESVVVRCAATAALVMLGEAPDQVPLARLLFEGAARERAQAAFLLGEIGNDSAVPMLLDAARAPLPRTNIIEEQILRLQIAEALVKLGHEGSIEPIRAALFPSRPQELEVAALAIQIIGQVDDRRSIDQLVYMADRSGKPGSGNEPMPAEIRLAAAASLAQLGLPRGAFLAREYLDHELPALRAQALLTLGTIGDRANLEPIGRKMDDSSGVVSIAAASAILRILPPESLRLTR